MKITMQQTAQGEEEMIIRYRQMSPEIEAILHFVENQSEKLVGTRDGGEMFLLIPSAIYYFESVDGVTYAYQKEGVYRIGQSLNEVLTRFEPCGFFRCSRTMVVNIHKMERLKSEPGGRILATLSNEEKIIISRRYAGALRDILKKGRRK